MQAIAEEMARRRLAQTPLLDRMIEVRDRYDGDVIVPVPDMDDDVPLNSLAPLLIAEAVDFRAQYAAQVPPTILVPALSPGKATGVRSTEFAARRRKALAWTWDKSWWELVAGRMFRHLAGYATSVLVVDLDFERRRPNISTRDPLSAYPEPKAAEDLTLPRNVGFITGRSVEWLHHFYPQTHPDVGGNVVKGAGFATSASEEGELWDVVEWMDEDDIVLGVLGPRDAFHSWTAEPIRFCQELTRYPNLLGRCPAVIPRAVTMSRIVSQLSNVIGHSDVMAKLMYLDIRATERSVFPSRFVLAKSGQQPRLVDGEWHEGETGLTNLVVDADTIGELRGQPDPNNKATMDRVERNMRVSSGLVPQAGGETYGALRTGRGIDSLSGIALDPKTAELHRVAERYLGEVNELVLLAFRKRWPSRSYSVGSPLDPEVVEFVPETHVELDRDGQLYLENRVHYPLPGLDDINATQVIGQMVGAQLIPLSDGRRMHPHIHDPEGAERKLIVEQLNALAMAALGQRASQGGLPPEDMANIIRLVVEGKPIHEAIAEANQIASERQASAPPPAPEGMVAAPEEMPGLAMPGEGAEMGAPTIAPPPEGLQNLQALAQALKQPAAAGAA